MASGYPPFPNSAASTSDEQVVAPRLEHRRGRDLDAHAVACEHHAAFDVRGGVVDLQRHARDLQCAGQRAPQAVGVGGPEPQRAAAVGGPGDPAREQRGVAVVGRARRAPPRRVERLAVERAWRAVSSASRAASRALASSVAASRSASATPFAASRAVRARARARASARARARRRRARRRAARAPRPPRRRLSARRCRRSPRRYAPYAARRPSSMRIVTMSERTA